MAKPTRRRRSSTRRWDIDQAILALLESGPKTASRLVRLLNPNMHRACVLTARGWKSRLLGVRVDYRVLKRHLSYLQRDGLITCQLYLKSLHHDLNMVAWDVKYYLLRGAQTTPTPTPSPFVSEVYVSKIHNPFIGEEGALRYLRWLRDP